VNAFAHQLRFEQLIFWRSREAAIFVFLLPVLLFVLLGAVYSGEIDGHQAATWLLIGMIGYGLANTAFGGLAIFLVLKRESGILKRLRATPAPAAAYLSATVVSMLIVFALQIVGLGLLGLVFYDAELPAAVGSFVASLALGAVAFTAMGIAGAAVIRSSDGASPLVNVVVLPMAFLSGSFGRTSEYPEVLQAVADVLPLKYFLELVRSSYLDGDQIWQHGTAVAIVAAWGIGSLLLGVRRFDWSPRER
jgi:ABC-2 type transport system permease protein